MEVNEIETWERVAGELAEELHRLRRILLGLAEVLPPQYLPYLDTEFNSAAGTFDALTGWDETAVITSDVITELEALWQRMT